MKRMIPLILSLLILCGCAAPADGTQNQDPPPTEGTAQEMGSTYPSKFESLPVTKEAITSLYAADASRTVEEIAAYEGDFLVRYTDPKGNSLWDWVFGETGRIVNMISGAEEIAEVSVIRPGHLRVTTTGVSSLTAEKSLPRTYEVTALGSAAGLTYSESGEHTGTAETALPFWLRVNEKAASGHVNAAGEVTPDERYCQLYDARVDVEGLSFAFIPSGDPQRYLSFRTAVKPACYETSFDEESRLFTLRLFNTALASGEGNDLGKDVGTVDEAYGIEYPYAFPAGALGRDNRFVKGASITQDGEDLVILMTLTEYAAYYTVETGDLGENLIPTLRFVFSEWNGN